MQIATASQLDGFYYKPRVDHEYLAEHAQGLIALSSCGSGRCPGGFRRDSSTALGRLQNGIVRSLGLTVSSWSYRSTKSPKWCR